jgi:hypothetical protein
MPLGRPPFYVCHCKAKYYDYYVEECTNETHPEKGDPMMTSKTAALTLAAALVFVVGCVTTPHTYIDKKRVMLTVPGCS